DLHSPALRQLLQGYVEPLLAAGCDTIILGCTHYPFLKPLLKSMIPEDISLIDTGAAVARQLERLLGERELLAAGPARQTQFWTSGDPYHFRHILPLLWKEAGAVQSFAL
ncbi:aspartate/glutamate racemase family protein, partial [Pseudomonas chlororaphis]